MSGAKARKDLICVGAITGVHGVRGVLTIRPFTENPDDVTAYGPVSTRDGARTFELEIIGAKKGGLLARIDGINDRTAAEALKGLELFVPRAQLPDTDEDDWYQVDLIGLEVREVDGAVLGQINAVQNYGAGDLLEVRLSSDRKKLVLLPFTRAIVPEVNVSGGYVTANPPDGLLDED